MGQKTQISPRIGMWFCPFRDPYLGAEGAKTRDLFEIFWKNGLANYPLHLYEGESPIYNVRPIRPSDQDQKSTKSAQKVIAQ